MLIDENTIEVNTICFSITDFIGEGASETIMNELSDMYGVILGASQLILYACGQLDFWT